jgi:hypothetical protein
MLDLKKLDKQFDEILASFDEAKLQQWIDFADEREQFERLSSGESVDVDVESSKPNYLSPLELSAATNVQYAGENNYALAA